jgi:hypothetical protein
MHIFWIVLVFCNSLRPIEIISFYLFQQLIPWRYIGNNLCWPCMQYLDMGVNQYLIAVSHNIKVKKSNSIAMPLFDLPYSYWGYIILPSVY